MKVMERLTIDSARDEGRLSLTIPVLERHSDLLVVVK